MIERGEIWWVRFGPSVGGEIRKTRPAVVVSNNAFNRHMNRVQVVALTSNVSRLYPGQSLVKVGNRRSKAMTDQILKLASFIKPENMVTEPYGRSTALACGLAAWHLDQVDPEAVMIVLSTDHLIRPAEELLKYMLSFR